LEKLNYLIGSYFGAIKAMFSFRLWTPFFLFMLISLLLAWLLAHPFLPVIGPLVASITKFLSGNDAALHYPTLYVFLPKTFGWISLIISVLLEVLLLGCAFVMFSGSFRKERISFFAAFGRAKGKYLQIVGVWLFYTVILLALLMLMPKLFDPLIGGSPRRTMVFNTALRHVGTGLLALIMYMLPYILIDGERFVASIGRSVRTCLKNIIPSYVIAVVPYLIMLPFSISLFNPGMIVQKFSPELVFYLIVSQIVANMFAGFVFAYSLLRYHWQYAE